MQNILRWFSFCLLLTPSTFSVLYAAEHTKDSLETVVENIKQNKAVLLDVRELSEWNQGHVKNAVLVPLSKLKQGADKKKWLESTIPAERIIYTHCARGYRALIAGDLLKKQGYEVRCLKQGYQELLKGPFEQAKK